MPQSPVRLDQLLQNYCGKTPDILVDEASWQKSESGGLGVEFHRIHTINPLKDPGDSHRESWTGECHRGHPGTILAELSRRYAKAPAIWILDPSDKGVSKHSHCSLMDKLAILRRRRVADIVLLSPPRDISLDTSDACGQQTGTLAILRDVLGNRIITVETRNNYLVAWLRPYGIPRVIHQVWMGPSPPPLKWMRTWQQVNPDWEYRLWTKENFPWPLQNQLQFDCSPRWSGKINVLRYELLYQHGGLYLDCDQTALRPIRHDFDEAEFFAVYEQEKVCPGLIANGIIGSEPGHPILADLIEEISRLMPEQLKTVPAWQITGPMLFTRVVERHLMNPGIRILPSWTFLPKHHTGAGCSQQEYLRSYAEHHWGSTHGLY